MAGTLKSAYFTEDEVSRSFHSEYQKTTKVITNFPISRSCLWTRKYCSFGIEIHPHDIIPVLHLYSHVINETVERLSSTNMNVDCLAVLMNNQSLSDSEIECLAHRSPKVASIEHYRLVWVGSLVPENQLNPFLTIKIPVTMRSAAEGIKEFEIDRTQNLLKNLENGLKYGRNFGLRSCLRIRATGCYHQQQQHPTSPNRSKIRQNKSRITLKYEAILPSISFQARQIHPLPLQLTPLSRMLTLDTPQIKSGDSHNHKSASNNSAHQMGYLTLTETRKVLVLHETDSSTNNVMSTPVVGVWVSLPDLTLQDQSSTAESIPMLLNPIIWGCCVRYLMNQNILEKVWVDENTFLLVIFTSYDNCYFEMTPTGIASLSSKGLESPINFLCYDFTTDLFSSEESDSDANDSILAKFRPTKNLELIRLCNPSTSNPINPNTSFPISETISSTSISKKLLHHHEIDPNTGDCDSMTPQPRVWTSKPETIVETRALIPEEVVEEESHEYSEDFSSPSKNDSEIPVVNHQREYSEGEEEEEEEEDEERNSSPQSQSQSPSYLDQTEYVPKELYLRQQQTIYSLQQQVEMLQHRINSLEQQLSLRHIDDNIRETGQQPQPKQPDLEVSNHQQQSSQVKVSINQSKQSDQSTDMEEGVETIQINEEMKRSEKTYPHTSNSYYPNTIFEEEEEEESFLCEKPFERCEMEAPSIFNFDLFVQTLKNQQDTSYTSIALPLEASLSSVPTSFSEDYYISKEPIPLIEDNWQESESILNIERKYGK